MNRLLVSEQDVWQDPDFESGIAKTNYRKYAARGWKFGEKPPYEIFNYFMHLLSDQIFSILRQGLMPWDPEINYKENGMCLWHDSEDKWYLYISKTNDNLNHEPPVPIYNNNEITDPNPENTYWRNFSFDKTYYRNMRVEAGDLKKTAVGKTIEEINLGRVKGGSYTNIRIDNHHLYYDYIESDGTQHLDNDAGIVEGKGYTNLRYNSSDGHMYHDKTWADGSIISSDDLGYAKGPKGDKGPKGNKGPKGPDGSGSGGGAYTSKNSVTKTIQSNHSTDWVTNNLDKVVFVRAHIYHSATAGWGSIVTTDPSGNTVRMYIGYEGNSSSKHISGMVPIMPHRSFRFNDDSNQLTGGSVTFTIDV